MPMVAFEGGQYSVPHALVGETVWVRVHGRGSDEQIVVVHIGQAGPVEVARHRRTAGSTKMRVKMTQALALAKLFDPAEVDWALGHAAVHSRFAEADLASILDHHAGARTGAQHIEHRAGEDHSLTQGTSAWAGLGTLLGRPGHHDSAVEHAVEDAVEHVVDLQSAAGVENAEGEVIA